MLLALHVPSLLLSKATQRDMICGSINFPPALQGPANSPVNRQFHQPAPQQQLPLQNQNYTKEEDHQSCNVSKTSSHLQDANEGRSF